MLGGEKLGEWRSWRRGRFGEGRWCTRKSANELAIFLKSERWGQELSPATLSPALGHFPVFLPLAGRLRGPGKKKKKRKARRHGTRFMNKVEAGEDKL